MKIIDNIDTKIQNDYKISKLWVLLFFLFFVLFGLSLIIYIFRCYWILLFPGTDFWLGVWRRLCLEALFLGYIFVLKELFATIDWRQYPLGLYISLSLLLNFICTFLKKSNSWQQTITNILCYFIWFIFLLYIFFIAIEFYYF